MFSWPDEGGNFQSCPIVLKFWVWLLRGCGRYLKATLQTCAPVEGQAAADPGARTPIGTSGIFILVLKFNLDFEIWLWYLRKSDSKKNKSCIDCLKENPRIWSSFRTFLNISDFASRNKIENIFEIIINRAHEICHYILQWVSRQIWNHHYLNF